MGKKQNKGNRPKNQRKFDPVRGRGGEGPKDRSTPNNENCVAPKASTGPEEVDITEIDVSTAISCSSEDQINIDKVFSVLHVIPNEADEPVVALEQEQPTEVEAVEQEAVEQEAVEEEAVEEEAVEEEAVEEEASDENKVMPDYVENEGTEETDEVVRESRTRDRKPSEGTTSTYSNRESKEDKPPKPVTEVDFEKKDEEIDTSRATFIREYYAKFAGFLDAIDPEVRFVADIGPCETFDSEGFQGLFDKMKENGSFEKAWPFDENFKATAKELTQLSQDIFEKVNLCMLIACAERGYQDMNMKKIQEIAISSFWGSDIDPLIELKTLEVIIREMKSPIEKLAVECEEMNRFWENVDDYFGVRVPALETFDSKTLEEKRIVDSLLTVYGRKAHGFDISEEEVSEMLVSSFETDGCGDFPATVRHCISVFTTTEHLKLINSQLEKMSEVVDIRVKLAGIQAITQIIGSLENVTELMEEMRNEPKVSMKKVFAIDPETFDPLRKQCKRTEYFKMFYNALQGKDEDYNFTDDQIASALLCFYLIFPPFEVNTILYKIIGTKAHDDRYFEDIETIIRVLRQLPSELKERIEVGEEFFSGEVTDDQDSMYYVIKHAIQNKKCETDQLNVFLTADVQNPVFSVERVMRMCIKFIESGLHQQTAVSVLNLLRRRKYKEMVISAKFFEDLLLLALSKYSLPDERSNETKFKFLDSTFNLVDEFKKDASLQIDEKSVSDRWVDLGHHWFTMLYLSNKYSILKLSTLNISYPWQSADVWDEKDTTCPPDPKRFAIIAKVSLAWPDCTDLVIIQDLVAEHVPPEVNRCELYKYMREYTTGQEMPERWKSNLLKKFDDKIRFLTNKEGNRNEKTEDIPPNFLECLEHEEVDENLQDAQKNTEEPKDTDKEDAEVSAEKEEYVETEVAVNDTEEDLKEDVLVKDENETKEEVEQSENVPEKLPQQIPLTDFMKIYSNEEMFSRLPPVVKEEVIRQREEAGY